MAVFPCKRQAQQASMDLINESFSDLADYLELPVDQVGRGKRGTLMFRVVHYAYGRIIDKPCHPYT